ncbi:hypothetical protein BN946_scf184970.g51 [Trametes cinnabarina]|uniref:Uncharacterized protein n=1 Tax=Pycnoporus cinnabarinus TaxID=5643 RepID=A0A060SIZ7_PYCCI|nr:hypothetical protein BN946_scf184970.g51 [Trametes cinnabarina]
MSSLAGSRASSVLPRGPPFAPPGLWPTVLGRQGSSTPRWHTLPTAPSTASSMEPQCSPEDGMTEVQSLRERLGFLDPRWTSKGTDTFGVSSAQIGSSGTVADGTNFIGSDSAGPDGNSPVTGQGPFSAECETFPEIDEKGWYVDKPRARADFPDVPYWRKRDWNDAEKSANLSTIPGEERGKKGPTWMANGENVSFRFITDAHGVAIDGERAQTIRRRFREFCKYLHNNGKAPATWQRGIDTEIVTAYHHWMRTQCYELQLCEDNWKADKVAILSNYSQWKKKYEKQLAEQAEKAQKTAKQHKKNRHAKIAIAPSDKPTATQDRLIEDSVSGTEHPEALLDDTLYRLSVSPPPPLPAIRAHSGKSQSPEEGPATKRARTDSSNGPTEETEAVSTVPPLIFTGALSVPNVSNATGLSAKVCLPNPLTGLTWASDPPAASTPLEDDFIQPGPTHSKADVPLRGTSAADSGADSVSVPETETITMTVGIDHDAADVPFKTAATVTSAADNVGASFDPISETFGDNVAVRATLPKTVETTVSAAKGETIVTTPANVAASQNKGKKRAPKPRKVTTQAWPPPDDDSHGRPKDVCARIWSMKNPDGTREEFDVWYKNLSSYKRNAYAASGGRDPSSSRMAASSAVAT